MPPKPSVAIPDPVLVGITGSPSKILLEPHRYKAVDLQKTYTFTEGDGGVKTVDTQALLMKAWAYVRDKCAQHKACNTYFATLPGKLGLDAVLQGGSIVFCALDPPSPNVLRPMAQKTHAQLPYAVTNGRQISFNPLTIMAGQSDFAFLCGTMVHELAHVAGATGDPTDAVHGGDAEQALRHCLLTNQFDATVLGYLERRLRERTWGTVA